MTKHRIFSRFFTETKKYSLSEICQYMATFYFNMRTVHLHTFGKNFLEIHSYAEELYSEMEDFYDDFAETAISYDEFVPTMNVTPGDYQVVTDVGSDFDTILGVMLDSVRTLFDKVENVDKERYASFVASKCDSVLEWLDKQNYKLKQMCEV